MKRVSLPAVHDLSVSALCNHGLVAASAHAIARNMTAAERDGARSHGLFRLQGYCASLASGKVNKTARPVVSRPTAALVRVDACGGYAPWALEEGLPALAASARASDAAAVQTSLASDSGRAFMLLDAAVGDLG